MQNPASYEPLKEARCPIYDPIGVLFAATI
jgi:hypothetical protein